MFNVRTSITCFAYILRVECVIEAETKVEIICPCAESWHVNDTLSPYVKGENCDEERKFANV